MQVLSRSISGLLDYYRHLVWYSSFENEGGSVSIVDLSKEENTNMNIDGDDEPSLVIDEILDDFCEFEIKEELDGAENPEMAENNLVTIYPSEINYSVEERSRDEEGEEENEEHEDHEDPNLGEKDPSPH